MRNLFGNLEYQWISPIPVFFIFTFLFFVSFCRTAVAEKDFVDQILSNLKNGEEGQRVKDI
jgi:hypothetical protein